MAGPIEALLGPSADPRPVSAAGEIDRALGLDDHYPAVADTIRRMADLLRRLEHPRDPDRYQRWMEVLSTLARAVEGMPRVMPTGLRGNILGGRLDDYPVAGLILQPPLALPGRQAEALVHLYLDALIADPHRPLGDTPHIIRRAIAPGSRQTALLRLLPSYDGSRAALDRIVHATLAMDHRAVPDNTHALLSAIERLRSHDAPRAPAAKPIPTARARSRWMIVSPGEDPPLTGRVETLVRRAPDDLPTDSPEVDIRYVVGPATEPDADVPTSLDLDAGARESRLWVRAHATAVPGSYARFTPIERRHWVRALRERLVMGDIPTRRSAGLLALAYLTGRSLGRVLNMACGPAHSLRCDGSYHRTIQLPSDAYTPADTARAYLRPRASTIRYDLPPIIRGWVAEVVQREGALAELLGVSHERATAEVRSAMDEIRTSTRYQRIRQERVSAALALELAVVFRDPVITHLIVGADMQAAPVLAYYLVHEVPRVQQAYVDVTQRLLA